MQFAIIGNPENRRVLMFCEAVTGLGYLMPEVISYHAWLSGHNVAIPTGCILKIESPGENDAVRKMLVKRGLNGPVSGPLEFGAISNMQAWYAGYSHWLTESAIAIKQANARVMNDPADIQIQFDKPRCQAWLQQQGIPVPTGLATVTGYDHLLELMKKHGMTRVFVKPAHASSASGVIAFRKNGSKVQAVTSAELVTREGRTLVYNSLKVRTYIREAEIAALVDRMAAENIFAEEWLPKATIGDRFFDLRVLVIAGRARHAVVRTSGNIITNLHLGNKRGDLNEFINLAGEATWQEIQDLAVKTASCFSGSLYTGIDLLLTPGLKKMVVLETNAFGDLLPGLVHERESCYEAEVRAMVENGLKNR